MHLVSSAHRICVLNSTSRKSSRLMSSLEMVCTTFLSLSSGSGSHRAIQAVSSASSIVYQPCNRILAFLSTLSMSTDYFDCYGWLRQLLWCLVDSRSCRGLVIRTSFKRIAEVVVFSGNWIVVVCLGFFQYRWYWEYYSFSIPLNNVFRNWSGDLLLIVFGGNGVGACLMFFRLVQTSG